MAESYIPQKTTSICTNMLSSTPQQLLVLGRTPITVSGDDEQPLLNANDKKLSDAFKCKNSAKLWGGLEALCAGMAVAALIVATVATGGLALVATAVAVGACIGTVAAAGAAIVTMNSCDKCLQQWKLTHSGVDIEGAEALLHNSFLSCAKGGVITIVLDPDVAETAAQQISHNNNTEVLWQMGSQFVIGAVAIGTGAGSGFGIALTAALTPAFYISGESDAQQKRADDLNDSFMNNTPTTQPTLGDQVTDKGEEYATRDLPIGVGTGAVESTEVAVGSTVSTVNTTVVTEAAGISGGGVTVAAASQTTVTTTTEVAEETTISVAGRTTTAAASQTTETAASRGAAVVLGDTGTGVTAVAAREVTQTTETTAQRYLAATFDRGGFWKGLGLGFAGAIANAGVDIYADRHENELYDNTIRTQLDARSKDSINSIGVISDR